MSTRSWWQNGLVLTAFLFACESTTAPPATQNDPPPPAAAAPTEPAAVVAATGTGTRGFVVSQWYDELPDAKPADCPDGMNPSESEYYEVDTKEFAAAIKEIGYSEAQQKFFPPDACSEPTAQPDPGFKTFKASIPVAGLDLDGVDSSGDDGSGCAHKDFTSPDGETGIDNQHWRLLGCTKGYQPDGQLDRMYREGNFIKEGFPILFELTGVDDPQNDENVEFRIFSSADPVTLSASGDVLRDLSLRVHNEAKYTSASAKGRIENGVLTTDPIDIRLRLKQQVIDDEFFFRDARVRAKLLPDGRLEGVMGYYWDTENFYKVNNDHYIGDYHSGRIAAETRGYMCAGIYHAIPRIADGHPDPETGKCTSISAAMHFEGMPAFVIEEES
ncbi:MAG: hypothetical protein P8R42_15980 [Candidatus Binatia bacterium]|nr:hypothetical protein [Candidatus Binatia bacterium]